MKKTFSASLNQLRTMLKFVREHASVCGFDDNKLSIIEVAAEEVIVNIIFYSYPETLLNDPSKRLVPVDIEISCLEIENLGLTIVIKDHGIPHNPLNPRQDLLKPEIPIEKRPVGGFGIFILTQVMDEVTYYRENNQNVLTMTKKSSQ